MKSKSTDKVAIANGKKSLNVPPLLKSIKPKIAQYSENAKATIELGRKSFGAINSVLLFAFNNIQITEANKHAAAIAINK